MAVHSGYCVPLEVGGHPCKWGLIVWWVGENRDEVGIDDLLSNPILMLNH